MATPPPDRPRRSRVAKVDLSKLTERQIEIRAHVVALGEHAYGPRWQTPLAAALAKESGRAITPAQVSHWLAGRSPVPEALIEPLMALAAAAVADLDRRAAAIRAAWTPDTEEE